MESPISSHQFTDTDGRPEGGQTFGRGFVIAWQRGPLGRGEGRVEPNGAFVEDVIAAAADRIDFYNDNGFACDENHEAVDHLRAALDALQSRTARREAQDVEGTHDGN